MLSFRQKTPNGDGRGTVLGHWMGTENGERVPVLALDELIERQV